MCKIIRLLHVGFAWKRTRGPTVSLLQWLAFSSLDKRLPVAYIFSLSTDASVASKSVGTLTGEGSRCRGEPAVTFYMTFLQKSAMATEIYLNWVSRRNNSCTINNTIERQERIISHVAYISSCLKTKACKENLNQQVLMDYGSRNSY
jgi:hypothetical protein